MYVEVSIPITLFKTFTYMVPKKYRKKIFLGQSVQVTFNKRKIDAFIIEIKSIKDYSGKVLNIISINDNCFKISNELWKTLNWISKYYICPIGKVLKQTIQYQHKKKYLFPQDRFISITPKGIKILHTIKYAAQKKILFYLNSNKIKKININELNIFSSSFINVCKKLEQNNLIKISSYNNISGMMAPNITLHENNNLILSRNQDLIYKSIINNWKYNQNKPAVLDGPSGSGKTLLYIKLINIFLNRSKQIIVLVPEISLISQIYNKINNLYSNQVGIWHSKMKQSEKNYVLEKIKNNQFNIIISTRSGLFVPFNNLGLIVVDEEHESSFKQEQATPYYNARDVAIMRSQFSNSSILLVSSVPSIETYFNIKEKKYFHYYLLKKYNQKNHTKIKLVDMSNEKGFLSRILINEIEKKLINKEQIVILQNKKGLIRGGIQKVESVLYKFFPNSNILRYDKDIISKPNTYYTIIDQFNNKKADILLGTQMIAKGLNFNNVSLVAIINADIGLFLPDFRSGERIFQQIYQFIGRANQDSSTAIIQSFNIQDRYIKDACKYKVNDNFNHILKERKELFYPPYSRLIKILFLGENKNKVEKKSEDIAAILLKNKKIIILGPSIAPISQIKKLFRYQLLLKCNKRNWQNFYNWIENNIGLSNFESKKNGVQVKIDVDPISIL